MAGKPVAKSEKSDLPPDVAAADYLADIIPELVRVADRGGLETVAYLLDMARIAVEEKSSATRRRSG